MGTMQKCHLFAKETKIQISRFLSFKKKKKNVQVRPTKKKYLNQKINQDEIFNFNLFDHYLLFTSSPTHTSCDVGGGVFGKIIKNKIFQLFFFFLGE